MGLKLTEFSDREFLYAVDDSLNKEGWATVHMIQGTLQLDHPYATSCIGSRLSYLRKLGIIGVFDAPGLTRWFITPEGALLMEGKFTPKISIKAHQVVAAMRFVNEQIDRMDPMYERMASREFRYGNAQRKIRR